MPTAKDLIVKPIRKDDAQKIVRALHYSHATCSNSQFHLGVFLDGKCGGAMQFGGSMNRRAMQPLVSGTGWNEFIELNRMAFADWLPRNSESRALGFAMRWIKKTYPHLKWVVSFSDATQCGDGTIYRASGFVLTDIKKNSTILRMPDGSIATDLSLNQHPVQNSGWWKKRGAKPLVGFQLRYIYFLDPAYRARLVPPEIPFSEIAKRGAGMYRGQSRVESADSGTLGIQSRGDGATPISTLPSHPVDDGTSGGR